MLYITFPLEASQLLVHFPLKKEKNVAECTSAIQLKTLCHQITFHSLKLVLCQRNDLRPSLSFKLSPLLVSLCFCSVLFVVKASNNLLRIYDAQSSFILHPSSWRCKTETCKKKKKEEAGEGEGKETLEQSPLCQEKSSFIRGKLFLLSMIAANRENKSLIL